MVDEGCEPVRHGEPGARRGAAVMGAALAADGIAARVGADLLAAGGSAADAAVAVAAALAVVDPANCGIGGYGGFAVVDCADGSPATQICFNTAAPVSGGAIAAGRMPPGAMVAPAAVVAGLSTLQRAFGRLDRRAVWAPAVRLARDGFPVGSGLAAALEWARGRHRGLNAAFQRIFLAHGEPLRAGAILRQPELADSLARIAAEGAAAMQGGDLVRSICNEVRKAGGHLSEHDFSALDATASVAARIEYRDAEVWAPEPQQCGAQVLYAALRSLQGVDLGEARGRQYVAALGAALAAGAQARAAAFEERQRPPGQTSHLCVVDGDGMMVSMTFTHGPTWFGSGLVAEDTGILLNAGAHLFVRRRRDAAVVAVPHLCPIALRHGGSRYVLGSPGGWRIPAIVLQAVVDLVNYAVPLGEVFTGARVSVDRSGALEGEAPLAGVPRDRQTPLIEPGDYFGPAGALGFSGGEIQAGIDPRFAGQCAYAR